MISSLIVVYEVSNVESVLDTSKDLDGLDSGVLDNFPFLEELLFFLPIFFRWLEGVSPASS